MKIEDLWLGEDFEYFGERYCLVEFNGKDKEVIAVKMTYNFPKSHGNVLLTFFYGTKVKFIPRSSLLGTMEK